MRIGRLILFAAVLLSIAACKKDLEAISYDELNVGEDINLRDVHFVNGQIGFACGGNRDSHGAIFRTADGGQTWDKVFSHDSKSINCIGFFNDSVGYAGGDFLHLLKTTDGGLNWNFRWLADTVPTDEDKRPAFKEFQTFFNIGYMIGGEDYDAGVIYMTNDAGNSWTFHSFDQEVNSVDFFGQLYGIIGGYGRIYSTTDNGATFPISDIQGDYFTGVQFINSSTATAVGNNGGIYKSEDLGSTWETIRERNGSFGRRYNFNDVEYGNGFVYAVGENGLLIRIGDVGTSWTEMASIGENDLYGIRYSSHSGRFYIPSENGKIFVIQD
jgi:photosystem II stability/assembly factor-like uncharacterized protein